MKFTEQKLETAIVELLGEQGYPHVLGEAIELSACDAQAGRQPQDVLIKDDLRTFLSKQYADDGITSDFRSGMGSNVEFKCLCAAGCKMLALSACREDPELREFCNK